MIRDGGVPENAEKFTHAPHARRGFFPICRETHLLYFYSRASCEARHLTGFIVNIIIKFLLTRLMRGATLRTCSRMLLSWSISTHAPHARRDHICIHTNAFNGNFYSRASCEARHSIPQIFDGMPNFYSRASCEARL